MSSSSWPRILGGNLAVAGGLCAAWAAGGSTGFDWGWEAHRKMVNPKVDRDPPDIDWKPGCGREMPPVYG